SAGPNTRQNATLPMTCARSNGSDVTKYAPSLAKLWSPESVTHMLRFITAPKNAPASPQATAREVRLRCRPATVARTAPPTPIAPHAPISHDAPGPWPKTHVLPG